MKIFLIIIAVVALAFIIIQAYFVMSIKKTETQAYQVIQGDKDFEIRFYPAATMATIRSSAKSYKELGNSGFRKLAGYIFGGNQAGKQIAMTSPVHMDINDSLSTMSFVMPAGYQLDNLPAPNDATISLSTSAEAHVAAIHFGGFASDKDIQANTQKLEALLKANAISYYGNFSYLGYNPPFQLFGRRNEIIVRVNWDPAKL